MGIILKKRFDNNCILGVWEITENFEELFSKYDLSTAESLTLSSFSNLHRKSEWICTRLLLRELINIPAEIFYNEEGKPYLSPDVFNISISHSKSLVAVIICKKKKAGIDIEFIGDKIENVINKFLSKQEQKMIPGNQMKIVYLHLCWSAKESIYKLFSEYKLNFIQNIKICPFVPLEKGKFYATVSKDTVRKKCVVYYEIIKNYVLICSFI